VTNQDRLAIDVALLLPTAFAQFVTHLNARLAPPPEGFRFDETHLPHVSLAQLYVRTDDLAKVRNETEHAIREVSPLALQAADLHLGGTTSVIRLVRTEALERLHVDLMDRLEPFEITDGAPTAFVGDGEPPRPADVRWVERFRETAAYDRFDPHVTLGVGPVTEWTGLAEMQATRVTICHLGRFCTCRRVLADWTLTPLGA